MKKSTIILPAIVCLGMVQVALSTVGKAQSTQLTYRQATAQSKQNIQAKNYVAAEEDARKSFALSKTLDQKAKALTLLGETFYERKMYEQAREEWSGLTTLKDPKGQTQTLARLLFARSYKAEGDFDQAITEYKVVIDNLEKLGKAKEARIAFSLALGDTYLRARQFEQAREQFNQIFEANKDVPQISSLALFNLAKVDVLQKNFTIALPKFNQILAMPGAPEHIRLLSQRLVEAMGTLISKEKEMQASKSKMQIVDDTGEKIDALVDAIILGES